MPEARAHLVLVDGATVQGVPDPTNGDDAVPKDYLDARTFPTHTDDVTTPPSAVISTETWVPALTQAILLPSGPDWLSVLAYVDGSAGVFRGLAAFVDNAGDEEFFIELLDATGDAIHELRFTNVGLLVDGTPLTQLTETLENKRIAPRVYTTSTTDSLVLDIATYDAYTIQSLDQDLAITNLNLGIDFEKQELRIVDDGNARAMSWSGDFYERGVSLPTTTTPGMVMAIGLEWDDVLAGWVCLAVTIEE